MAIDSDKKRLESVESVGLVESVESVSHEERLVLQLSAFGADGVLSAVLVAPWGEVKSSNGSFVVDFESVESVIEAFDAHGTDLLVDYEHQSLGGVYSSPSGQAPAAGWIRSLRAVSPDEAGDEPAGLYAQVEWTEAAQKKLAAKEYRYLSPVVIVRKGDRRMVSLHSAALTNKPAIAGMRPIVNREAAECDEAVVLEANDGVSEAVEVLREQLGLEVDSDAAVVLLAAKERLGELMVEVAECQAGDRVALAMRAGKLTPAQRDWAMALALRDPAGFDEWSCSAPTVVMTGRIASPGREGSCGRDRGAVIASARATYRSEPSVSLLTSESAWIGEALREAGFAGEAQPEGASE